MTVLNYSSFDRAREFHIDDCDMSVAYHTSWGLNVKCFVEV